MSEEETLFLDICTEFLEKKCKIDFKATSWELNSGDLGVLLNKKTVPERLLGFSLREIKEYVANNLGKAITWADEPY